VLEAAVIRPSFDSSPALRLRMPEPRRDEHACAKVTARATGRCGTAYVVLGQFFASPDVALRDRNGGRCATLSNWLALKVLRPLSADPAYSLSALRLPPAAQGLLRVTADADFLMSTATRPLTSLHKGSKRRAPLQPRWMALLPTQEDSRRLLAGLGVPAFRRRLRLLAWPAHRG
jgi:hypothetical protein